MKNVYNLARILLNNELFYSSGSNTVTLVLPNIDTMVTAQSKECYYKKQKTTGLTHY